MTQGLSESRRPALLALAIITLAAAAIRIHIAATEAMWRDEAQTMAVARESFPGGILRALEHDGNAPLFYLATHFVAADRGAPLRELRDRSISVIAGIALVPLAYLLSMAIGGSTAAALFAATWFAVAPIVVDATTQTRPYGVLCAVVAGMALFALRTSESRYAWIGYAVCAVAAFYLHTFAAAVVAAFALVLLAGGRATWRAWLVAHLAIGLAIIPGLLLVQRQVATLTTGGRIPWGSDPTPALVRHQLLTLFAGDASGALRNIVALLFIALLLIALVAGSRAARIIGAAGIVALLLAFVLALRSGGFATRYHLAVAVPLIVVACSALRWRWVAALTAIGYAAFVFVDAGLPRGRSSSREIAAYLDANARPGELVIILPDALAVAVNYYLPPRHRQIDAPSIGRVERIDFRGWPERYGDPTRIEASLGARRAWLVVWLPMTRTLTASGSPFLERQWRFGNDVVAAFRRRYHTPRQPARFSSTGEGAVVYRGFAR